MKLMKMMKHVLLFTDTMFGDVDPYPGKNLLVYSQTKILNIWLFQHFFVERDIKEELLLFLTVKSVNTN